MIGTEGKRKSVKKRNLWRRRFRSLEEFMHLPASQWTLSRPFLVAIDRAAQISRAEGTNVPSQVPGKTFHVCPFLHPCICARLLFERVLLVLCGPGVQPD